jgi:hypothetical protein
MCSSARRRAGDEQRLFVPLGAENFTPQGGEPELGAHCAGEAIAKFVGYRIHRQLPVHRRLGAIESRFDAVTGRRLAVSRPPLVQPRHARRRR